MGYKLKDMLSGLGISMSEFKKLDNTQQEELRKLHRQKHSEMQSRYGNERSKEYDAYMQFLNNKGIDNITFQSLTEGQKRFFEKQYQGYKKQIKIDNILQKYNFEKFIESLCITIEEFEKLDIVKQKRLQDMHLKWAVEKDRNEKIPKKKRNSRIEKFHSVVNYTPCRSGLMSGDKEYDYWMNELASMGIPMGIDGPLGVGWDD